MKFFKELFRYIIIFIVMVFLLTAILTLVASIPRKYVEKNLKEATGYFGENYNEVTITNIKKEYAFKHPYADGIILNIIYCLDTENPLESVLEAKYYTKYKMDGTNTKYLELIENDYEGNTEYLRYWHGSIVLIKPLLIIFTLEQIYLVSAIVLLILIIANLAILIKKKYYSIAISMLIGLVMVAVWIVPTTFEYIWTFLIMLITSIICIIIEDKNRQNKNKRLYTTLFITGILTCFFDFLTTEIITILVPLAIVLSMRIKNKNFEGIKKEILFVIKSMVLWFLAYSFMWVAKWVIASLVLEINVVDCVKEQAMNRVNGKVQNYSQLQLQIKGIQRNLLAIYPVFLIAKKKIILKSIPIILLVIPVFCSDKKDKNKMQYLLLMTIIAIIPYIRYFILANHSHNHAFFVFRSQLPTIMCIILVIANCSNKEKLFSQIRTKQKGK